MGYQKAIEACGLEVEKFKEFGSYQGDWIAILKDGRVVSGSYGSCSGCDAFQAEFDWGADELPDYNQKLATFAKSYVDGAESLEDIIKRYEVKCEGEYVWDDDKEILEWLKQYKNENSTI